MVGEDAGEGAFAEMAHEDDVATIRYTTRRTAFTGWRCEVIGVEWLGLRLEYLRMIDSFSSFQDGETRQQWILLDMCTRRAVTPLEIYSFATSMGRYRSRSLRCPTDA